MGVLGLLGKRGGRWRGRGCGHGRRYHGRRRLLEVAILRRGAVLLLGGGRRGVARRVLVVAGVARIVEQRPAGFVSGGQGGRLVWSTPRGVPGAERDVRVLNRGVDLERRLGGEVIWTGGNQRRFSGWSI